MVTDNGEYRNCKYCGSEFYVPLFKIKEGKGIYCSKVCVHEDKRGKSIICANCKKEFKVAKSLTPRTKYCSMKCRREDENRNRKSFCKDCNAKISAWNSDRCRSCAAKLNSGKNNGNWSGGLHKLNCDYCGIEIKRNTHDLKRSEHKFCSKKCKGNWTHENVKESQVWNWKGGVDRGFMTEIRDMREYRRWRKEVFKRDYWTCQECEYKGKAINAHHTKTFADIIAEYGIDTLDEAMECEALWDVSNGTTLCKKCHKKRHTKLKVA